MASATAQDPAPPEPAPDVEEVRPTDDDELVLGTYQLIENLNLDVVAAYLFAGDATSLTGENDEDPFELGTRLSLSF